MFSSKIFSQISISLILLVATLSPANAQSEAESIVERWVDSAREYSFVNISYGSIEHDSASNITTVNNLKVIFNKDAGRDDEDINSDEDSKKLKLSFKYSFDFPVIEFDDLTFDGDYYSARSISAESVLVNFAMFKSGQSDSSAGGRYKKLKIANIRWANLPEFIEDDEKPVSGYFPIIEAMLDISFDKASVESISMVQETENPPLTMRTDYGRMEIGETSRGNFSSMFSEGLKMEIESSGESPQTPFSTDVEFGNISATDYNYRTLLDRITATRDDSNTDSLFQTFMGHFVLEDIRVTSKAGNFSLESISAEGVDVRSPDIDILDAADRVAIASKEDDKDEIKEGVIDLISSFYGMFRLNEFQMTGMKFSSAKSGDGKLDVIRVSDLSSAGMGEILLEGVNFSNNKSANFNLDHYSLSDFNFPSIEALVNLETATKTKNIAEIMKAIPTLANITIKGLRLMIPGKGEISVAENSITMDEFIGPIPTNIQIQLKDFNMPTAMMDPKPRKVFTSMGYDRVGISFDASTIWKAETKVVTLQTGLELSNGGLINFDLSIGGIPRSIFENPQTIQSAAAFATLNQAEVTFADNSIVEKGLKLAGSTQGVNADTMKAQVVGMLPIMLQVLDKPAFVDQLTATVKNFLDKKGSITASAIPASPVLILQLLAVGATAPGTVVDLLNVNVASN